ncbi:hypothetical protein [Flavobacterium soli]|nr:hypothetical protein [Flavobacterium soli]
MTKIYSWPKVSDGEASLDSNGKPFEKDSYFFLTLQSDQRKLLQRH